MQEQFMAWFLGGGSVSLPKRIFALMEPLGLDFEDIGRLCYLLSLEGELPEGDQLAQRSAHVLAEKGLLRPSSDGRRVDFQPLLSRLFEVTGLKEKEPEQNAPLADEYVDLIMRFEKEQGRFLSMKEKGDLSKVMQAYAWSADLTYEIYNFYLKNHRRRNYAFSFFAQMAHQAKVHDAASFTEFCKQLDQGSRKTREVLRRLGKFNNPSEAQKEMYAKWQHEWGFSHELILMATDDTVSADNPSFGYLDQILAQWREEGLKTPEHIERRRQERRQAKTLRRRHKPQPKALRNRLESSGESRDLSYLEE